MPDTRLYINLTNHCNAACPFCCMYSAPSKKTFIPLERFTEILAEHKNFQLQLEGGEPLLHPRFREIFSAALSCGECKDIIILTNGLNIRKDIMRLLVLRGENPKPLTVKASVNTFLIGLKKRFLFGLALAAQNTRFVPNFSFKLNVRKAVGEDDSLEKELEAFGLTPYIQNIFNFNRYGRLKNDERYGDIVIKQNIASWAVYASDGKCFGQDLKARSEYENELD